MSPDLEVGGFFVLRTPLLPFDELRAWAGGLTARRSAGTADVEEALAADRALLRRRLASIWRRPEVREALYVASPGLFDALEGQPPELQPPTAPLSSAERSLAAYFIRMAGRATPFGLCAGVSLGTLADSTRCELSGRPTYRRRTLPDVGYLRDICRHLLRQPALRRSLRYRPNGSLFLVGGKLHYFAIQHTPGGASNQLYGLDPTPYLDASLAAAESGASLLDLAAALTASDDGIAEDDALAYLEELVAAEVLSPELAPNLTGATPLRCIQDQLSAASPEHPAQRRIDAIERQLQRVDRDLCAGAEAYRQLEQRMRQWPVQRRREHLIHVELVKPAAELTLGSDAVAEVIRAVELVRRMTPADLVDPIAGFRDRFLARYGDRRVPMLQAIDPDLGVGYDLPADDLRHEPALLSLDLPPSRSADEVPWGDRERYLVDGLSRALANGEQEIVLDPATLPPARSDAAPLPDAFAADITLLADDAEALAGGDFHLHFRGWTGPSAAVMLGRFASLGAPWHAGVVSHLRAEEALHPDAIFAEIVHLPPFEGRAGNVIQRPLLRDYEIPCFGRSAAPPERQIPLGDLEVTVESGEVQLHSQRLARRVLPRLSCAHSFFRHRNVPVYRFLASLQRHRLHAEGRWSWRPFSQAPFLPRVRSGRVILAPARWNLSRDELRSLRRCRDGELFRRVQDLRSTRRLPRWVVVNELPLDLENPFGVELLAHEMSEDPPPALFELLPDRFGLCATAPEGSFVHELILPLVRHRRPSRRPPPPPRLPVADTARRFPPGSRWLSARLFSSRSQVDDLIVGSLAPFIERVRGEGMVEAWYFLRYGEPSWHLRLRFRGDPDRLCGELLPALHEMLGPALASQRLYRIEIDTYEREVERYGGLEGVRLAERLFQVDSEAVLRILAELPRGEARWQLALDGVDRLLADLRFDLRARRDIAGTLADGYFREFRGDTKLKRSLARLLRRSRGDLERWLDPSRVPGTFDSALSQRSRRLAPLVDRLTELHAEGRLTIGLEVLARSYCHLHVNRLLPAAHRAQEMMIYDFLSRHYASRLARSG